MTPRHNVGGPEFWQQLAQDISDIKESQAGLSLAQEAITREQAAMREAQKEHDIKTDKIMATIYGDPDHPDKVGIMETLRNHDDRLTLRGTLLTIFGGVFFWLIKMGKELWDKLHGLSTSHTLPPGSH